MKRKLQVFVSSTFADLRAERQAAVEAILENRHIPAGMELFAAGNEDQMSVIRRWIDESDVYVLILGKRYGSVDPKSNISYTELEYAYAVEQGKPLFALVLSTEMSNAKVKSGAFGVEDLYEQTNVEKLRSFTASVMSKMCSIVEDTKDIRLAIARSLRELEERSEFAGWVSGKEFTKDEQAARDAAAYARRVMELQEENAKLRARLEKLSSSATVPKFAGRTFEEVSSALTQREVEFPESGGKKSRKSLLSIFELFAREFAIGVTNRTGVSDTESFLFFTIVPELIILDLVRQDKLSTKMLWRRYILSEAGKSFLAELDQRASKQVQVAPSSVPTRARSRKGSPLPGEG